MQAKIAFLASAAMSCMAAAAEVAPEEAEPAVPDAAELERQGAVIGEVFIYNENIFDLEDPEENKQLYRLANKLHIRTQPQVIRQQLLFKSGDPYSQRLLDESARILRSARYLYDASIRPVAFRDGRVDIAVTTRDVWTLNPGLSFSRNGGENTAGVELEELNLLGTGTDLSIAHISGVDRDSTLIEYKDRHVFDTLGESASCVREQQRRLVPGPGRRTSLLCARYAMGGRHVLAGRRAHPALVRPGQGRRGVRFASEVRFCLLGMVGRSAQWLGAALARRRNVR